MEITNVFFEHPLVLIINNQKISITPFLIPDEPGTIKLGIDAPFGVPVNREEIYLQKQKNRGNQLDTLRKTPQVFAKKIQTLFQLLMDVPHKSEKLEEAAKRLFNKDKILTPKTIETIARGEASTTQWIITCAIDLMITARPALLAECFKERELYLLWAKPLITRLVPPNVLLQQAQTLNMDKLNALIKKHCGQGIQN